AVDSLTVGEDGLVVLDQTPFYAEAGGQTGDTGVLVTNGVEFSVADTRKRQDAIVHVGKVIQGSLSVGQRLSPQVDEARRLGIMQHNSGTDLMHGDLQRVLGEHVQLKRSSIGLDYLRFYLAHDRAMRAVESTAVEKLVNEQVFAKTPVTTEL